MEPQPLRRYIWPMTDTPSDDLLRQILTRTKTIACIGVSTNPIRPSHYVARYLSLRGYRVIPVNPAYAGQELLGETVRGDLSELVDEKIDMIDIFRRSEAVPPIVDQSLDLFLPNLQTIWM